MNAKNVAGNTALHVAASRNSVDCAQVLALRGASREILNKTFQSPLQTASISQSEVIFEFLRDFKDEDISLYLSFIFDSSPATTETPTQ